MVNQFAISTCHMFENMFLGSEYHSTSLQIDINKGLAKIEGGVLKLLNADSGRCVVLGWGSGGVVWRCEEVQGFGMVCDFSLRFGPWRRFWDGLGLGVRFL